MHGRLSVDTDPRVNSDIVIENENLLSLFYCGENQCAEKNKSQSLSPLVSFSLSLQYNVTKTHKTCRKIIVLLFVCAGGIVVYSLCTIVSVQSV